LAALALLLAAPACGQRALGHDAGSPIGTLEAGVDTAAGGSGGHDGGGVDTSAPGDAVIAPDAPVSTPDASDAPIDRATPDLGRDSAIDEAPRDVAVDLPGDVVPDATPDGTPDGICGSATDRRNCGRCGHDCTALPQVLFDKVQCRDGACVIPADGCLPGFGHCATDVERGCESDITQRGRCGACGVSCSSATPLCTAATAGPPVCVASCAGTGLADCGGSQCVDLKTNNSHCGACNARCGLSNAYASCVAGVCTLSHCQAGYADCDPANEGCETILGRFFDCGACGETCRGAHANGICAAYGCELHCQPGYGNCDPSNPDCEATLDTAANCGACGAACPNDRPLCAGARGAEACVAACGGATPDACGTSCTNLQSDPRHCGACGTACESYQACEAGRCTPRYVKTDVLAASSGGATAGDVLIGPDGSVYVNGTFSAPTDFNPGTAQDLRTPITALDAFITKFNADGSYAWTRTWATPGTLGAGAIASDGSIYASGSFTGTVDFDPGAGVTQMTAPAAVGEAVILKLNASGQLQWVRVFTMTVEDAAGAESYSLTLGPDGSLYAAGSFRGQIDLDPGAGTNLHRTPSNDMMNGYVVKLTSAGNFTWGRTITSTADGWVGPLAVDASGALWVGGSFGGMVDLDPGAGTDMYMASGYTDGFLARWDANGNYQTGQIYSGGAYDSVDSVSFDADGSIYVGAESNDNTGPPYVSIGLVQKLGADGSLLWEQRAPSMFLPVAAPGGGVIYKGGGEDPSVEPTLIGKLDRDGKTAWIIPARNPLESFGTWFAADATKLIVVGRIDKAGSDLDPGAGTDIIATPGGAVSRYAF
jgi:hypothetical protein